MNKHQVRIFFLKIALDNLNGYKQLRFMFLDNFLSVSRFIMGVECSLLHSGWHRWWSGGELDNLFTKCILILIKQFSPHTHNSYKIFCQFEFYKTNCAQWYIKLWRSHFSHWYYLYYYWVTTAYATTTTATAFTTIASDTTTATRLLNCKCFYFYSWYFYYHQYLLILILIL